MGVGLVNLNLVMRSLASAKLLGYLRPVVHGSLDPALNLGLGQVGPERVMGLVCHKERPDSDESSPGLLRHTGLDFSQLVA